MKATWLHAVPIPPASDNRARLESVSSSSERRTPNAQRPTPNFLRSPLRRPCSCRLANRANNRARNRELDQVPDNPAAQDFSGQRLYRVEDEVITDIDQHH